MKRQTSLLRGALLAKHIAEPLVHHNRLLPSMGSAEAAAYFLEARNEDDAGDYYRFRPGMGIELDQRTGEMYELIFRRKLEVKRGQIIFQVYTNLIEFPTEDLYAIDLEDEI